MEGDDREISKAGGDLVCRFAGDIAVIRVKGRLDLDLANHFVDLVKNDLPDTPTRIVLNCQAMEYLTSAGVSLLLQLTSEHRLRIVSAREEILGILDTVGIRSLLSIHETEEAAVVAFVEES